MKELLKKSSTLILLGTGGVGKTTVAAALGLAAAASGLDTGLITIDPSRRLRDALGLEQLNFEPTRLDARRLRSAGLGSMAQLSAMVLDVKRSWDGLVERFVHAPESRQKIFDNAFYRSLTEKFAGAEAYAALEQLYDLHADGRFDFEIVDTPPAGQAFEFIEAPAHLTRLLDSRAARWLFMPHLTVSKTAFGLASRMTEFVVERLENFAGVNALSSVGEFFNAAADATGAISDRFRKVGALLHSPEVHFVLVTTTEPDRLKEASKLVEQMENEGLGLGAIVINRFLDERTYDALIGSPNEPPAHLEEIRKLHGIIENGAVNDGNLSALMSFLESYDMDERQRIERAAAFVQELPPNVELGISPEIEMEVRDLKGLGKVARSLMNIADARAFIENSMEAIGRSKRSSQKRSASRAHRK